MSETLILSLTGPDVREMFRAATIWLEQNKEQVNAINVFPVPDGDTGTNMHLTMRSTIEEAERCQESGAGAMLAAMSHGALMGARGNSGVILSQIIRGVAKATEGIADIDAGELACGLEGGAETAYKAVTKPTEGTILTVMRDAAAAARASANGDVSAMMDAVVEAARESVARTPELLPMLKEAGVVDAGGQGLFVLLEGMSRHLRGETIEVDLSAQGEIEMEWLSAVQHQTEESPYGYCAEVLVEGQNLDADELRPKVMALGDSVIVVGDEELLRMHVHTDDPGAVLTLGTGVGALVQVKIDNINRQAQGFVEMHREGPPVTAPLPEAAISSVAVAPGEGLASVLRDVGCTHIVSGGPTMNPSTQELLAAIEACPTQDVVVLPNDKNIILAARQAADASAKHVAVVESRSFPQGLSALLAYTPEDTLDEAVKVMTDALASVRTVEITRAVRSTEIGGVKVAEGQVIAVVDDVLKLAAETPEDALERALGDLASDSASLITLYYGADTDHATAEAMAARLRERFAGHDVEVVSGGQPHYLYIASLE
ncbi:MAG TPA: DAK2 domain-containing protein [Dehalococcoidia bacterium]|nr:DAK2 domain-containing protein [Dehalococcoidia bacterium]